MLQGGLWLRPKSLTSPKRKRGSRFELRSQATAALARRASKLDVLATAAMFTSRRCSGSFSCTGQSKRRIKRKRCEPCEPCNTRRFAKR